MNGSSRPTLDVVENLLAAADVDAYYGAIKALDGVSFAIPAGSVVTFLGANGAGKTTLVRVISGVVRARRGTITFGGRRIDRRPPHEIVRLGISQVPQGRDVFPELTVHENLEMGAYLRRDRAAIRRDLAEIYALFPSLEQRERRMAGTLSGGEQQMLAIGRALMARPRLLILDEPSLGLAPMVVEEIFATIARIKESGVTVLLVEQNASLALLISEFGYVLEAGRLVLADTAANLLKSEQVIAHYLGASRS